VTSVAGINDDHSDSGESCDDEPEDATSRLIKVCENKFINIVVYLLIFSLHIARSHFAIQIWSPQLNAQLTHPMCKFI